MIFDGFELHATPFISRASCRKCHKSLSQVSNGLLGAALYCPNCESVYLLKLIKAPDEKVSGEFLEQCRVEYQRAKGEQP